MRYAWNVEVNVLLVDCTIELVVRVECRNVTMFVRQIVLSLCVQLSCYTHRVALIHREFPQHGYFQTDYQVSLINLKKQVLRANVFHRSHGNGTFHL